MLTESELKRIFKRIKVDHFETLSDITEDNAIELGNVEELCSFIERCKINTVFYHFSYAVPELFQITDEVVGKLRLSQETLNVMEKDFISYNRAVCELDFSRPYGLTVYCVYQGYIVYAEQADLWFCEMGYDKPEKTVKYLVERKRKDIQKEEQREAEDRKKKREQLHNKVLNDKRFWEATNKNLRRAYQQRLLNEDPSLRKLFYSPIEGIYDISFEAFVEEAWKEYKASQK